MGGTLINRSTEFDLISQPSHEGEEQVDESEIITLDTLGPILKTLIAEMRETGSVTGHRIPLAVNAMSATLVAIQEELGADMLTPMEHQGLVLKLLQELTGQDGPIKAVPYNALLNPENDWVFEKTLDEATWDHLQLIAEMTLQQFEDAPAEDLPNEAVQRRVQSIASGDLPAGFMLRK